jgi:hypothetical protein
MLQDFLQSYMFYSCNFSTRREIDIVINIYGIIKSFEYVIQCYIALRPLFMDLGW